MPNFGPGNAISRGSLADFCSKNHCRCSGPDALVSCRGSDHSCVDTTCEECFNLGGKWPAGDITCWDWNQLAGSCIKDPGIIPGYCSCELFFDQVFCEYLGGIWGGYGSNCDGICLNPHDECEYYPPPHECLDNCLAAMDVLMRDHMNSCREVYDGDMEVLKDLLKKMDPDDPTRCLLLCEVERMFCDCKEIGEKKRCLLNLICWEAYDQRNGTDGAQAVFDDCMSRIDETSCIGGLYSNHCNCAEILERSTSSGACCLKDNQGNYSCLDINASDCAAFSGTPWPNTDDYDSYTCADLIGDGCPDGTPCCAACNFDDEGSGCFADVPTGACCIENQPCVERTEANCNAAGGLYWWDNLTCGDDPDDPCVGQNYLGACCCQWCSGFQCNPCSIDGGGSPDADLCENDMNYADCWSRGNNTITETVWHYNETCCDTEGGQSLCFSDFNDVGDTCGDSCNECPGAQMGACCYTDPNGGGNCIWENGGDCLNTYCGEVMTQFDCSALNPEYQYTWKPDCVGCGDLNRGPCCIDSTCYIMSQTNCITYGGSYDEAGTQCETQCTEGACCLGAGVCETKFNFECDGWFYENQTCGSQCNVGACCYDDSGPSCTDYYIIDECNAVDGTFHESDVCDNYQADDSCFTQLGACCYGSDCTDDVSQVACSVGGGVHVLDECANINCSEYSTNDITACCLEANGHDCFECRMETPEDCGNLNGNWISIDGESCPLGVCCLQHAGDGAKTACLDTDYYYNCITFGGTWAGPDILCGNCEDTEHCAICEGSCCYIDGGNNVVCQTTNFQNCNTISGGNYEFGGHYTNCNDTPCVVGACCHINGVCDDTIPEWNCNDYLDVFYKDQNCEDVSCDNPNDGSCCLGGICYPNYLYSDCQSEGGVYDSTVDNCSGIICENIKCCQQFTYGTMCADWVDNQCNCLGDSGCINATGMPDCDNCVDDISFACCEVIDGSFTGNCNISDGVDCDGDDLSIPDHYCSSNPCELGACCYSGVCLQTVDYDCGLRGGDFNINNSCDVCYTDDVGSCCIDFEPWCLEVPEDVCTTYSGSWTQGETCQDGCGDENWGACCQTTNQSCSEETSFECGVLGGIFHYHTECSDEICEYDGTCVVCNLECFCEDENRLCCPDGSCDFPCDSNACGMGPACPLPLQCCEGTLYDDPNNPPTVDDYYCAYSCNGEPELVLCCTAPNGGFGNFPCETDNTDTMHSCMVKSPEQCAAGGGAVVGDCGVCHDVCCPIVCCMCLIGPGCESGEGCETNPVAGCLPMIMGYDHTGECSGEATCGSCSCEPCASSNMECEANCPQEPCDCGCVCSLGNDCGSYEVCFDNSNDEPFDCCCCCNDCSECCAWNNPDNPNDCTVGPPCEVNCCEEGVAVPARNINPLSNKDILTNLNGTHTYVELPSGECIWMECIIPNCPYPLCDDANK